MKIVLTYESPIHSKPRRLVANEKAFVDSQIKNWLDAGIIKESVNSPFSSPIVLVKKKNDDTDYILFEDEDMPFIDEDDEMDSAFRIVEKCRRPNKKFNSEEAIFQVIVDPDRWLMSNGAPTIGQTTDAIRTLFETLLRRVTSSLEPTDLMRVIIFSDHLDRPISTHLMLVSEMSVEKIMACAVKVLQSKSEVRLDEGFNVEIITIRRPVGSAILLAIAEVEKDADLKSLRRKDCDLLKRRAIALHQKTGVPQGPCGFEEIALFEQNLKMQVVVISTTASNQVCYKGPDRKDRRIYLWLHDNHFDVITSPKEMLRYCRSDVDILRRCCKIFREEFQSVTGVDPFTYVTIASACMAVYRSGHIKQKTIAMIPVQGYCNSTNFSRDSIRWLDFIAHTEGHQILHALNGVGEQKIARLSVDGFCKETNTVYQYQGCFHHGCEMCYDGDLIHPLTGTTMRSLLQKTKKGFPLPKFLDQVDSPPSPSHHLLQKGCPPSLPKFFGQKVLSPVLFSLLVTGDRCDVIVGWSSAWLLEHDVSISGAVSNAETCCKVILERSALNESIDVVKEIARLQSVME
ncbi:uncharacterized protein NPIL_147201 [Nephila pilipes]|uniref:Uncharacterized protein n=1 Tax=Nephila pilipes TaxID=299642 RepID=A0A8X6QKC0_NEPPI|nr:uncharacterized protein NPIL_147201 [Nephila pilipes]